MEHLGTIFQLHTVILANTLVAWNPIRILQVLYSIGHDALHPQRV